MADRVIKHLEECKDPPKLFTYYQGDINTAVDEHFFRALNKVTTPKDLSTKAKDSNRIPKSGALMCMHLSLHLAIYLSIYLMRFLSQMFPHHHGLLLVWHGLSPHTRPAPQSWPSWQPWHFHLYPMELLWILQHRHHHPPPRPSGHVHPDKAQPSNCLKYSTNSPWLLRAVPALTWTCYKWIGQRGASWSRPSQNQNPDQSGIQGRPLRMEAGSA